MDDYSKVTAIDRKPHPSLGKVGVAYLAKMGHLKQLQNRNHKRYEAEILYVVFSSI